MHSIRRGIRIFQRGSYRAKCGREQLEEIKKIYKETTPQDERIRYQLFYNHTNGIEDFVETFRQRLQEQNGLLEGRFELFFTAFKGGGTWWNSITQTVPVAQQLLTAISDELRASVLVALTNALRNPPTALEYQEHRSLIDNLVIEVPKLLLVAHSQGNLFVNVAYDYAISKTSASAVGVVHIAPASPRTTGPHTLADLDLVINGLRAFGSVPPVTSTIPGYLLRPPGINHQKDIQGHGLLEIYLNPELVTAREISANINAKIAAMVPSRVRADSDRNLPRTIGICGRP